MRETGIDLSLTTITKIFAASPSPNVKKFHLLLLRCPAQKTTHSKLELRSPNNLLEGNGILNVPPQ